VSTVTGILADESGMGMNCSSVPDIYRDFGTTQKDAAYLEPAANWLYQSPVRPI